MPRQTASGILPPSPSGSERMAASASSLAIGHIGTAQLADRRPGAVDCPERSYSSYGLHTDGACSPEIQMTPLAAGRRLHCHARDHVTPGPARLSQLGAPRITKTTGKRPRTRSEATSRTWRPSRVKPCFGFGAGPAAASLRSRVPRSGPRPGPWPRNATAIGGARSSSVRIASARPGGRASQTNDRAAGTSRASPPAVEGHVNARFEGRLRVRFIRCVVGRAADVREGAAAT